MYRKQTEQFYGGILKSSLEIWAKSLNPDGRLGPLAADFLVIGPSTMTWEFSQVISS